MSEITILQDQNMIITKAMRVLEPIQFVVTIMFLYFYTQNNLLYTWHPMYASASQGRMRAGFLLEMCFIGAY